MHGDGLTHRTVAWPVFEQGRLVIRWLTAAGRRFWCPCCGVNKRVAHPGLREGATYAAAAVAALLHVVAAPPSGAGGSEEDAFVLARGRRLPPSERCRSGTPRWSSIRRWIASMPRMWPAVICPTGGHDAQLRALMLSFGLGATAQEVVEAAVLAHARRASAM